MSSRASIAKERYEKIKKSRLDEKSMFKKNEIKPIESRPSDIHLSNAVHHPALIVTRDIEWGTIILGFEQANKYTVLNQDGEKVALIAEDITGIGNVIGRQVLRTRRNFTSTVFSADGNQILFKIRRPMYLINSSMYVEDGEDNIIGEIHKRWHLFQRNYDLYIDKAQFAKITGNFLAWEFELKDDKGGTMALIDRNFQGFAKELFTDAGKYVIHFGDKPEDAARQATETLKSRTNNKNITSVTPMAKLRTGITVIPQHSGNQLIVSKKMNLNERMITLACAMTIDYDYFSRHSSTSGLLTPPIILPIPGGGGGDVSDTDSQTAASNTVEGNEQQTASNTISDNQNNKDEWLDSGEVGDKDAYENNTFDDNTDNDDMDDMDDGDGGLSGLFGSLADTLNDS